MQAYEYLEKEWAEFNHLDPKNMVACSSGTAALHLALECVRFFRLEAERRMKVIVPDFTMIACARAVTLAGMQCLFADCNERGVMEARHIAPYGYAPAGAVMPVHIYGRKVPQEVIDYCNWNDWHVIEDLSEAHGLLPHPRSFAACWSFYKNKIIHGEEGGAVWFKNEVAAEHARRIRSLGMATQDRWKNDFIHIPRGHNYRMSNCHAQLVRNNLKYAEQHLVDRRQVEGWYDDFLPSEWRMPVRDVVWVYDLRIPNLTYPEQGMIVNTLNSMGIEARCAFKPMRLQEEYQETTLVESMAGKLSREIIYLPVRPDLTKRDVERNVQRLIEAVKTATGVKRSESSPHSVPPSNPGIPAQ